MLKTRIITVAILGILVTGISTHPAMAQCEEELAELDRLLESGDLNDQQLSMVRGMRQSATYLCGAGQEAKVREMLDNIDNMLNAPGIGSPMPNMPGQSGPAQRQADEADDRLAGLTVDYLQGNWCVTKGEPGHYRFNADGTYASAPPGYQLSKSKDMANFREFFDRLESREPDRFVVFGHGRETVFVRGTCEQAEAAERRQAATAPPVIGKAGSETGQWINRPEDMLQFWYRDTDRLGDKVRILYSTSPSLEQGQSGSWTANVYVVEISPDGETSQHRLYSKQSLELVTMALRRGHDQVLAQRKVDGAQNPDRLEAWSVPGGEVLSSVDIPAAGGPDGTRWSWSQFRTTTLDGNVIFTTAPSEGRRSDTPVSTAAWMEVSPEGEIIGRSSQRLVNAKHQFRHWFPAHTGGAGAALDITKLDEQGLSDLIDSPIDRNIGGREIRAVVRSETRLAITDADTNSVTLGPALERDLMWVGEMSIPQDLPADQRLAQNNEQMMMMARTEIETGARRHIRVIKPTAEGYGVLMRVVGDRRIEPDVNGRHFVEVALDGARREVFLEPAADELEVQFENFAAGDDGTVYLFGNGRGRSDDYDGVILPVSDDGSLGSAIPISVPNSVSIDAMISAPSGVWLVGHGMNDTFNKVALWVSQIDLDKAGAIEKKAARPSAEDRQRAQVREQTEGMEEQAQGMMAAMAGMSPEQFNSLSREEQKALLEDRAGRVQRQGGQQMAQILGVSPEALQQMSEAEKSQLFKNLDPEQLAKLMAMSRSMSGRRGVSPTTRAPTPPGAMEASPDLTVETLTLDPRMRGMVRQEFSADTLPPFTLTVRHEDDGGSVMERRFNGAFAEEIDFAALPITPDQAVIEIADGQGRIIRRLQPERPR